MMKIIVDNKIPYIKGVLEPFAEVVYMPGSQTTPELVKDADALITRTRTKCNRALLEGSSVKMIATATIGFDHIDTEYCKTHGIEWTNAPGCNSWSVAQYIMAVLHYLAMQKNMQLDQKVIGVVGAGNVGSKVARLCKIIGMNVLVNDPPRQRIEGEEGFAAIEEIQQKADIITFHTPLTFDGNDKTYHIANKNFLSKCKKGIVFINSSRGEVMDTEAVKSALKSNIISDAVIDCWESEPDIDRELLKRAFITTPHIAGYSKDGKANGTKMSVQAISRKFNLGLNNWECKNIELPGNTRLTIDAEEKSKQQVLTEAVLATYTVWEDSDRLKKSPETFEKQRGDYPVRREFPFYTVELSNATSEIVNLLKMIGFQVA